MACSRLVEYLGRGAGPPRIEAPISRSVWEYICGVGQELRYHRLATSSNYITLLAIGVNV